MGTTCNIWGCLTNADPGRLSKSGSVASGFWGVDGIAAAIAVFLALLAWVGLRCI